MNAMNAKRHTHRTKSSADKCWSHCVTPAECAAQFDRQAAHGNIIRTDTCRCGAQRQSEINFGRKNSGRWA